MVDSDDDMPPPLEDMGEKIDAAVEARKKTGGFAYKQEEEQVEEVRLGGGKPKSSIPMSPSEPEQI